MTAIRTNGLTKRFGDIVAVKDLDLHVERGDVFGFLGPNGSGKSTVINLLLDFVRPTAGSASVLGYDTRADATQVRRHTGVVPEGASLYGRLTGREHLAWTRRANDAETDVDALLDRVGLDPAAADRRVGGYSTGMRRRLALGMALVGDPELLILDEPSAGLDPSGMQQFRELVRTEAAAGRTVFFSSHVLDEVEAVADRIGILDDGRLVATGTPDDLRARQGLATSIRFDVADVPDFECVETTPGVEGVDVEPVRTPREAPVAARVTVRVADPSAKIDAATRLADRTEVLDVVSEDAPLERLFDSYTATEREARPSDDTDPRAVRVNGAGPGARRQSAAEEVGR